MLNETENMLNGFLGLNSDAVESWEQMESFMKEGRRLMIVMPWGKGDHQVVAEELKGDRVVIFNSLGNSQDVGKALGGSDGTPARVVEADGMESMALSDLAALYKSGKLTVRALPSPS